MPVIGATGTWDDEAATAKALALFLRWSVALLRPDRVPNLEGVAKEDWLDRTSWRPMLAVMCHFGFAPVPDFRDRYRRRVDESAGDNLCGLWSVGPSTFYRYLEKGKQQLTQTVLLRPLDGERFLSLRRMACHLLDDSALTPTWHVQRAKDALVHRDPTSALWHYTQANELVRFMEVVERFSAELATTTEVDVLVNAMQSAATDPQKHAELLLAIASIWRTRNVDQQERGCYEQALRIATAAGEDLTLGIVYGALGKFYETRDSERAFACYEDSARYLSHASREVGSETSRTAEEYVKTLLRMAWMHVLKNNPQARKVLDQAQQMRAQHQIPESTIGLLEQAWGEYWRRAGDIGLALQHKHRALNIFERLDDLAQMLSTYNNLSMLYGKAEQFDRANEYAQKVIELAQKTPVDPYVLASTRGTLGANLFRQGRYADAIFQYELGLRQSEAVGMQILIGRARYNLAEAHYKRFQLTHDPKDEQAGDVHAAAAYKVWSSENNPAAQEATLSLKNELLGPREGGAGNDRLLPEEFAAHFADLREVQRHRATLALPMAPASHVHAHLAIARAYLAIATKEREAALALIHKHELGDQFAAEFEELRSTFNRELTREEQLAVHWKKAANDLLNDERRAALLSELLRVGSVNKSGYAKVCGLGLATASKHLGMLTDRGLLIQSGRGPSTRYCLPDK
jgi:tetratricopeptide (TPR) repeat protein